MSSKYIYFKASAEKKNMLSTNSGKMNLLIVKLCLTPFWVTKAGE